MDACFLLLQSSLSLRLPRSAGTENIRGLEVIVMSRGRKQTLEKLLGQGTHRLSKAKGSVLASLLAA